MAPSEEPAIGNASHELSVSRLIAASPAAVFRTWTERLAEWWAPLPWTTEVVARELRPGGRSAMVMRRPAGEEQALEGVFLEVVPDRRIVFTNAFAAGWVPQPAFMVALFTFEAEGKATRYTAAARHWSEEARIAHEGMGFHAGWTAVADQLARLAEG